jgi:D-serine deaminase-like pyridoxal phosphate-dependent protein
MTNSPAEDIAAAAGVLLGTVTAHEAHLHDQNAREATARVLNQTATTLRLAAHRLNAPPRKAKVLQRLQASHPGHNRN